jgi:cytochrome c553
MLLLTALLLAQPDAALRLRVADALTLKCLSCHGGASTQSGLDLTRLQPESNGQVVVQGKPKESRLYLWAESGKMPQAGEKLTAAELRDVAQWIEAGAPALNLQKPGKKEFWSLRSPVAITPPKGSNESEIDAFLRVKLTEKKLLPNPRADQRTLIRRLHFDLTGLAPKPEDYQRSYQETIDMLLASPHYAERWARHWLDVVRFGETDGGEHNYERFHAWPYRDYVIDAFKTDKPYTQFIREQIAGDILEPQNPKMIAATGFLVAGPWDQVSAELNKDKILAATARVDELDDMATTTFHTFQALTVNCARCHDHKFDPIPSKDFYRLTAVFGGVTFGTRRVAPQPEIDAYEGKAKPVRDRLSAINRELGNIEDPVRAAMLLERYQSFDEQRKDAPRRIPVNPIWNRNRFEPSRAKHFRLVITGHQGDRAKLESFQLEPAQLNVKGWTSPAKASVDAPMIVSFDNPEGKLVEKVFWWSDQSTGRNAGMPNVFRLEASEDLSTWVTLCSSLDHIRDLELDLPQVSEPELLQSLTAEARQRRQVLLEDRKRVEADLAAIPEPQRLYAAKPHSMDRAFLLDRGSVATPKEEVSPGALSAVKQLDPNLGLSLASADKDRRLALANWIASERNPLSARVIVNRIWYSHFGNGIVNTPSDFGLNGDRPSHPELLDWLAVEFMRNGWSIKWLHRKILSSEAYQQSSALNEAAFASDADNRLLWRMPLKRMDAEMLRDTILQASGALRLEPMGGPSFLLQKKKDRGAFIYEALHNDGPEVWRRAIYRFVVRGGERIMMDSFDCPDPSVATPQRSISNTPVQALTLLNNEFVLQQATLLAQRLEAESGPNHEARIQRAYQLLFGRNASPNEVQLGISFLSKQPLALYTRALLNSNEFVYVP